MARTNIEIDDALVSAAMARYGLRSKREVVDVALRHLIGEPLTRDEALGMEGSGWDGELDDLRASRALGTD